MNLDHISHGFCLPASLPVSCSCHECGGGKIIRTAAMKNIGHFAAVVCGTKNDRTDRYPPFGGVLACSVGVRSWANQNRGRSSRQSKSGARGCPPVQSIAPETFTLPWRVSDGRRRRRSIGRSRLALRSAWRNTGLPAHIQFQIAASLRLFASCNESRTSRGGCSPDLILSSDGGPGIHQPGSNAQGTARDRVICPAAVRFDSRADGHGRLLGERSRPPDKT